MVNIFSFMPEPLWLLCGRKLSSIHRPSDQSREGYSPHQPQEGGR